MNFPWKNGRIYLDHASTTPIDPVVLKEMNRVYKNGYFNPGGLYREGVLTSQKISECRKSVASLLGTTSDHVVFTRGGTESNNMAILGILTALKTPPPPAPPLKEGAALSVLPHVIVSAIEHAAVLETVRYLEQKKKIELSVVPVTSDGIVDMDELKKALRSETVLVSVMYVNNEIGTIQPIKEIAKLIRWHKKNSRHTLTLSKREGTEPLNLTEGIEEASAPSFRGGQGGVYPLFHTDAIQAANYLDINVERLGVDLMSLSGSKIYGPKSSGMLYVRNKELVAPLFHGGDQEFGLRAGTEDIAQIVGLAKALEITREISKQESARLGELQAYFLNELRKNISDIIFNGAAPSFRGGAGGGGVRVCNNINVTIPGISGERLVIELDAKGICASSRSACTEDSGEESHVIKAIRTPQSLAGPRDSSPYKGEHTLATDGALRFTFGRSTTKQDLEKTLKALTNIVKKIKDFDKHMI